MMNNSLVTKVDKILNDFNAEAVIFDLDGTLLDNNPYHLQSWKKYLGT
jgi:beta-phosphoglucomutase